MSKEAMKLALEALESCTSNMDDIDQSFDPEKVSQAIIILREALAEQPPQQDSTCSNALRAQGKAYPRTCKKCGLGPCVELANQALDKMAENARELGLDYEPAPQKPIIKSYLKKDNSQPVKWSDYEPDGMHHNKRPQNCGTGYCSCIECVMEPAQRKPPCIACGAEIGHAENCARVRWGIEKPEQEPVAIEHCIWARNGNTPCPHTTPPHRKPLTDEQFALLYSAWQAIGADITGLKWSDFVEEIGLHEAKLKENI